MLINDFFGSSSKKVFNKTPPLINAKVNPNPKSDRSEIYMSLLNLEKQPKN